MGSFDAYEGNEEYNAVGWARREYSPYPFFWHNGSTFGAHTLSHLFQRNSESLF